MPFRVHVHQYPEDSLVCVSKSSGVNAACFNAVTLALVDAGIPLNDFFCACSVANLANTPVLGMSLLRIVHQHYISGNKRPTFLFSVFRICGVQCLLFVCVQTDINYIEKKSHAAELFLAIQPSSSKIVTMEVCYNSITP